MDKDERHHHGPAADRYVEAVRRTGTVYGPVRDLTDAEETRVRDMYREGRPSREAVVEILRGRGKWPNEPNPRKTYAPFQGARGLPRHDRFGRLGARRRRRG
jgi:hypothetical protein